MSSEDPKDLREDLDAGMRFLHVMGMQTKTDVSELSTRLFALVEELIARGVIDLRTLEERRQRTAAREVERTRTQVHVQVADHVDKYGLTDLPVIDCEARLSLCRGRCCQLSFPLSFQDVEERVIQWNYALPYQIRKREDGYCVHNEPSSRRCQAYTQRPAVCRTYDCRNDRRIWQDFDKGIPAPEDALLIAPERLARRRPEGEG